MWGILDFPGEEIERLVSGKNLTQFLGGFERDSSLRVDFIE
jgi:hypothetical protein